MKKILSIVAITAITSSVFAADIMAPGVGNSNTGCGLGSVLIKTQDTLLLQLVASCLNGTSGNQTFGITTGTSGCKKATKIAVNERAQEFIAGNMDQLSREIAQGHGESIATLAELLAIKDVPTFATALQANYNTIYTNENTQMHNVADNIAVIAG